MPKTKRMRNKTESGDDDLEEEFQNRRNRPEVNDF